MTASRVNLVEIDLLRRGAHTTALPVAELRKRAGRFDYHVSITRADRIGTFFAVPIVLNQRLPTFPTPLAATVLPVSADLQAVMDRCYDDALYSRRLHYDQPCDPPLTPEQQAWAEAVLRAKGVLK